MRTAMKVVVGFLLVVLSGAAYARETDVGDHIESFSLPDQFDRSHVVNSETRLIVFSRDKDMAKLAFEILDRKESNFLANRKAVMLLDISAMPRIITWAIGKRRMRRHEFPILLDAGPGPTANLPSKEKAVSFVYLKDLVVSDVAFVSDAKIMEKTLDVLVK